MGTVSKKSAVKTHSDVKIRIQANRLIHHVVPTIIHGGEKNRSY